MAVPYFYIIKHKESGKKYAGAKWAKNANPENFMTASGYKTSSNSIKRIVKEQGLLAFQIEEIIKLEELQIPFGCQTIDEYESWFLKENSCCNSEEWYNMVLPWSAAFGTEAFYSNMMNKYGVKYPGQVESHNEKVLDTCKEKYGSEHYYTSEDCRNKLLDYIHQFDKAATNVWQLEITKEKNRKTCLVNHGVEYPAQSKAVFAKGRETLKQKYGVDSPMKSAELRKAHRQSCKNSLGAESPMQSEKVVLKYKANFFEKYGVGFPSQVKFHCGQCNKTSTGISNISRHHKNHTDVVLLLPDNKTISYTKHIEAK